MATSREIEREVENQRASVESTLEALKEKMSLGQIVDEFGGYVGADDAKHAVRNVGRQVRDNPLAFGLVSVGLAWLMMSNRRSSHGAGQGSSRDWEERRYSAPVGGETAHGQATAYGETGYRETGYSERATPGMSGDRRYGSAFGTPYQGGAGHSGESYSQSGGGSGGGSVLSRVARTVGGAVSGVTGTLSSAGGAIASAGGAIASAGSAAADRLSSAGGAVTGAVSGAGERVRHITDASGRRVQDMSQGLSAHGRHISQQGQRMGDSLMDTLERQPLLVGGFAVAVGVAIGAALPATRAEDRLLGEQRDDILDEAKRTVADLKDQAVDAARAGMRAAGQAAEEEGLTPTAEGKTLAAKVEHVVRAAVDEAKNTLEGSDAASDLRQG